MKRIIYISLAILITLSGAEPGYVALAGASSLFSCSKVVEIPQPECKALVALYNATNGPGWTHSTNWLVTHTPSDWYGW